MVCDRCEKKLSTLVTPDTWKDGSRNAKTGKMGRKVNVNMLSSKFGKNKRYDLAKRDERQIYVFILPGSHPCREYAKYVKIKYTNGQTTVRIVHLRRVYVLDVDEKFRHQSITCVEMPTCGARRRQIRRLKRR